MNKKTSLAIGLIILPVLLFSAKSGDAIMKIGPSLTIGTIGELGRHSLLPSTFPGIEIAGRCAKRFELWGSYKFNKKSTAGGHGMTDVFRLDAFAAGLRYHPGRWEMIEPFMGLGLDYYHLRKNNKSFFDSPVTKALGPFVQAGSYFHVNRLFAIQVYFQYNLVRHSAGRTAEWGTNWTDFSGMGFGLGILLNIYGK
jgi:hypothetical protein